ncbi:MAG: VTT domain-containing protein [Syntrophomonadaceae bacterium]|nr:VTT domain-containing protein [Syntrophomonadaceae bacterium]
MSDNKIGKRWLKIGIWLIVLTALLLLLRSALAEVMALGREYGFEYVLEMYEEQAVLAFFTICFLQPIAIPVPEAVTIVAGSAVLGAPIAFMTGYCGTVLGILTMFFLTKIFGYYLFAQQANSPRMAQYSRYVDKYGHWVLMVLFIVPILPDEIICVGAGLSDMAVKKYVLMAVICKAVSSFILAYSITIF